MFLLCCRAVVCVCVVMCAPQPPPLLSDTLKCCFVQCAFIFATATWCHSATCIGCGTALCWYCTSHIAQGEGTTPYNRQTQGACTTPTYQQQHLMLSQLAANSHPSIQTHPITVNSITGWLMVAAHQAQHLKHICGKMYHKNNFHTTRHASTTSTTTSSVAPIFEDFKSAATLEGGGLHLCVCVCWCTCCRRQQTAPSE